MGSSKKHKEKDRERKHKRKHRSRDRSRSKERRSNDKASKSSKNDGSKRRKMDPSLEIDRTKDARLSRGGRIEDAPAFEKNRDSKCCAGCKCF